MQCPQCQITLSVSDRQGIEIDYCPQCRGVWLDRGELDKIVARSAQADFDDDDDDDRARHRGSPPPGYDPRHREYQHRRRKAWWTELFD